MTEAEAQAKQENGDQNDSDAHSNNLNDMPSGL
jgi:hypothetical protein